MPGQESLIYDAPMVLQKDITFEDACKTVAKVNDFQYIKRHVHCIIVYIKPTSSSISKVSMVALME